MSLTDQYIRKMQDEHLPSEAINAFVNYFKKIIDGNTGLISESTIRPVGHEEIRNLSELPQCNTSEYKKLLSQVACIKLNGGLGTTMGLQGPKSLLPVKNGLNFLDITCRQLIEFNKKYQIQIPLILMNSFRTEHESMQALKKYPEMANSIPGSFVQNKNPKVLVSTLEPAVYPDNPELEWNPPGHGDIFIAFKTSGILDQLLENGYRYAFVSNIDNLGAVLEPKILGLLERDKIPFLMEVTDRTFMDRKGGHIARLVNTGRLILREAAQCPQENIDDFSDISKYSFFNTNNLWIDLVSLKSKLEKSDGFLDLPMIRNRKKLNPLDKDSPDVYQIECAMGTAISVFENAAVLDVPRSRFAPVKSCEDLLLLWSDAFIIDENYNITANPLAKHDCTNISLDNNYYFTIDQLRERFAFGAPSMLDCRSFSIKGDICFGKNISVHDDVKLTNHKNSAVFIKDNTSIRENMDFH